MRDFTQEMMKVWTNEGEQAAYDIGPDLLREIEAEQAKLKNQASVIKAFGKYLQDNGEVIARSASPSPELDVIEATERSRLIIEAATEVWQDQQHEWNNEPDGHLVKVQKVLERIHTKGLDLGVQQPLAVIGTVLASADGFRKVARNTFEYEPAPSPADIEDLPW